MRLRRTSARHLCERLARQGLSCDRLRVGPAIALSAAVLRSTALTILGTAGIPPRDTLINALQQVMAHAASGELHVDTEQVALADIEDAWERDPRGRRLVVVPRQQA